MMAAMTNRPDCAIDAFACRQHGAFTRDQALAAGITSRMIDHRLGSGRWLRLGRGVYALPSVAPTWERQAMAAVLHAGRAVVAGRSAAALHGLAGYRRGAIQVAVLPGANHRNPFAMVSERHQVESTFVNRIPVLTVEQTLFDLVALGPHDRVQAALDDALASRTTSIERLQQHYGKVVAARPRGLIPMRAMLEERSADAYVPPTTVIEAALYEILAGPGFPPFERQAAFPWRLEAYERVDALVPSWRLIVEADGRRWHSRVDDFVRDRRRDRDALVHGHRVVRFSGQEILSDPAAVRQALLEIGRRAA